MYGHSETYNMKNLEDSRCLIGLKNPEFRVSDERFCSTRLMFGYKETLGTKKYNISALINFFLIGFGKRLLYT